MRPIVRDARPPYALVAVLNPINRLVLRTPIGRAIDRFALLEFKGRRSGQRLRVPVLWHPVNDGGYVFSPATWPSNFEGGAAAAVTHRGRTRQFEGTLESDPSDVADAFNELLANGMKPSLSGLHMPPGHVVTAEDVRAVHRVLIRFERA